MVIHRSRFVAWHLKFSTLFVCSRSFKSLAISSLLLSLCLSLVGCHKAAETTGGGTLNAKSGGKSNAPGVAKQEPAASIPLPMLPEGGIKGIYLTGWTAGLHNRLNALCAMADRTDINAMVIDVKDDGELSYEVDVPLARDAHASRKMYKVDKVIATLNAHHIWPIARIACMRDTPLAKAHPELAVHGPDGQIWHDRTRHYWLNPYKKEVWDYNVDVALDALKHGFKEIQFDYVRTPSEGKIGSLLYPGKPADGHRSDQIEGFLKYAEEKIHAHGGYFSADVFGLVATVERRYTHLHPEAAAASAAAAGVPVFRETKGAKSAGKPEVSAIPPTAPGQSPDVAMTTPATKRSGLKSAKATKRKSRSADTITQDMGIGQIFSHLAAHVDYMCPMAYPSHYAPGEFGIARPNFEPYKIITKSVGDSKLLVSGVPTCKLRPWIQDFSLGPPHYGPSEVRAQIKALSDMGIHEYLLWNARCKYTEAAYGKKTKGAGDVAAQ